VIDGFTLNNGGVTGESGGAIYIGPGSSPKIANVTINNFDVTGGDGGAIYIGSASSSVLANVTINNCSVSGGSGGGIYIVAGSSPTLRDCTVKNCSASDGFGGGVYCEGGAFPQFIDSVFTGNSAGFDGGGLYFADGSTAVMRGCLAGANRARFGSGVCFGAGSRSFFSDCTFTANRASESGGGIYYDPDCFSQLSDCTVTDNTADGEGGGILYGLGSVVIVSDCNISGNSAGYGGGLYLDADCSGSIVRSVLADNDAGEQGGGIYVVDSNSLQVTDCNISYNQAGYGGGLYCLESRAVTITGCILRGNEASSVIVLHNYFIPDPNWVPDPNDPNATAPLVPISPDDPNFDPSDPNLVDQSVEVAGGAADGGGLYSFSGPALIKDCQFIENAATTSGGGVYFAGAEGELTHLQNCLFSRNTAGRDGAAISNNWYCRLAVSSCTLAENKATDLLSRGGGLYSSYSSYASMINSILWANSADDGSQIAVGSGDPAHLLASVVDINNCDIDRRAPEPPELVNPNGRPVIRPSLDMPGFDMHTLAANDDLYTDLVDIGFEVNYYGKRYTQLYVNNNGNVTFDAPMSTFTPFGLTGPIGTAIIAPFFADVDTRTVDPNDPNNPSKLVTYGTGMIDGHKAFVVNWVDVGYFGIHWDKLNSFQLVLIDRSDRAPGDFDIEFNYEQIQWETGDASGGQNGFGGESARAGFSNGTGEPGTFMELAGSGVHGAFLDSSDTGLIYGSRKSEVRGRYIFSVTSGRIEAVAGDPILVEPGCSLSNWDPNDPNALWDLGNNIIDGDPCFTNGYYLSHIDANQAANSVCIDAGSDLAANVGLGEYTTRVDGANDTGIVDLGYHYRSGARRYYLDITVAEDPNDPGIHGRVEPGSGWYYEGTELTLTAVPDEGYYPQGWYDQQGELISYDRTMEVVVDSNLSFTLRFRLPGKINVSGGADAISQAVAAAQNGDVLVVAPGTYDGGIDLQGKELTVTCTNPDDPEVVAETIIDCADSGGGFIFENGEDNLTVVDGFRIINAGGVGRRTTPVSAIFIGTGTSPIIANVTISDCHVVDAPGAGIYIAPQSSPSIRNVSISSSSVSNSDGGGIYVGYDGNVEFIACTVSNCTVTRGSGGAVFCSFDSNTVFTDCSFVNNSADYGGDPDDPNSTGAGGDGGAVYYSAGARSVLNNCSFSGNSADLSGGGLFCGTENVITVSNCSFTDNSARLAGGLGLRDDCSGIVAGTVFADNYARDAGGGLYLKGCGSVLITDCNVSYNVSAQGAGIYAVESPAASIVDCSILYNEAYRGVTITQYFEPDPNDPNVPLDPEHPLDTSDPNFDPNTAIAAR